jgi:transposase InsO family protein
MSRQNYYACRKRRQQRQIEGDLVEQLVQQERALQPRLGTRKLYHRLRAELQAAGMRLGRDRLFAELRRRGLLVPPVRREFPQTTQVRPTLPRFGNLVKGRRVEGPNQVWVSDLTYVRTAEGFLYLSLITDQYSRKIVGMHVGDNLEALGCVAALEAALAELPSGSYPVHHSDRGCQYCCHEYVARLRERGLAISMTETDHCAENALAERMNGILKQEYGLGQSLRTKDQARQLAQQAVWLYNTRRPHTALGYDYPARVHSLAA